MRKLSEEQRRELLEELNRQVNQPQPRRQLTEEERRRIREELDQGGLRNQNK